MINYYEAVARKSGGVKKTQDFFRLFMVPGMGHCRGGSGANEFGQSHGAPSKNTNPKYDIRKALELWVEKGVAPESIIATKYVDNNSEDPVDFTRPICPYPKVPVYTGVGDVNRAASFECKEGPSPN